MTGRSALRRLPAGLPLFTLLASLAVWNLSAARTTAAQAAVTSAESEWRQDLDTWRARRAQEIDSPDGWLTLVGLEWLKPGANSLGSAADNGLQVHGDAPDHIGMLIVSGKTVQLLATVGGFPADLTIDGQPAREGPLVVDGPKPSIIAWHSLTMAVLDRGGRFALRIKDSDSATRKGFHGLNWYAADPQFSVEATWTPYMPTHVEAIPTPLGTTINLPSPGQAEFSIGDRKFTLEPVLESVGSQTLFFILSDETTKNATYAGGRYLHAPFPDHGLDKPGKLILDFNRLENPPCGYTTYASCPMPPQGNRLPVAIEAGEKRYVP